MTEKSNRTATPQKKRWLRIVALAGGAVVVLLVIFYFVITSGAFVKGVILPKVGRAMNADLSASAVKLSPFSQIDLTDVKLTPTGKETLFTAEAVHARYSLWSIIGGKIAVDELTITSPTITLVEYPDGTSNLDPLMSGKESKPEPQAKSAEAAQLSIKSVSLSNGTFRQVKNLKDGGQDVAEVSNLNIALANLINGQSGKFDISAIVTMASRAGSNAPTASLNGKIIGGFTFDLTQDLKPAKAGGDLSFVVGSATGALEELNEVTAKVVCEISPTEITRVALQFLKRGVMLGEVRVSGPFDAEKSEGKIKVEVLSIDRRVLNLAGAATGIDFGSTLINSTNEIELTQGGNSISATGQFAISSFQVIQNGQTSPTLDINCGYGVTVDNASHTTQLKTLTITGTQNQRPLLQGELTKPMTIAPAAGKAAEDSAFSLVVTNLNLADWKAFAPEMSPQGIINASFTLLSQSNGSELAVDFNSRIAGLSVLLGADALKADLGVRAAITRRADESLVGNVAIENLIGSFGDYRFVNFGTAVDFDVATKDSKIELKKLAGKINEGSSSGGTFDMSGNYNSKSGEGQFDLKLADVNQYALRPFIESALAGKQLVSVSVNSTASVAISKDDTGAKADLRVANLIVSDPKKSTPSNPLELRLQVDASVSKQVAQVRQFQLTLTPTARAKNELNLTGSVDFSKSDAITGNLKLAAESLDVTSYYDLTAGEAKPAEKESTTAAATSPAPADETKEPDAIQLPFKEFAAEINIGRLYLHEVDVEKFQAVARVDGGRVVLKPCQLTLNGAPVNATVDLNLGVPGYQYDLAFNAQKVPLTPLVNSFQPTSKGQIGGTLTATAQIKGSGVTGTSLQKHLTGNFDIVSTNMNLSLKDVRSPLITPIINIIVGLPDLLRNPVATLGGWLTGAKGGWADKMTASPIDVILVNGSAGDGRVQLRQAEVRSSAFKAEVTGDVAIAPILTNSTINFPVTISLSRPLAEQIGQLPANTPTNVAYVALPDFVKETGTLGQPKTKTDAVAIAQIAARAGTGIFKGIGSAGAETGGSLLNKVEGILGGRPATNAPSSSTNNQPAGLFDFFKKPKPQ